MNHLRTLLGILLNGNIDFVIVGGFAAVIHGSSQVTQDLDICVALDREQIEKLRILLEPFHPVHRMTPQKLPFSLFPGDINKVNNLYLSTDLGPLDILGEISGIKGGFLELKKNAVWIDALGLKLPVISREDLLIAKKTLGRPKDLFVVEELRLLIANDLKK